MSGYKFKVAGVGMNQTATVEIPGSYLPLEPGMGYKWRVDAYNPCTVGVNPPTMGLDWIFKTVDE